MVYSRRLRLFFRIVVVVLLATFFHLQPTWKSKTYDYAQDFSQTVSEYIETLKIYNGTQYQDPNKKILGSKEDLSDSCTNFPSSTGIQFVMKTGATEAFDKLPMHLLTTLQCLPDFLLFSDMDQQIGKHHIYDVLAEVDESVKAHNDFNLYRDQRTCPVSQKSCVNPQEQRDRAWNLDKYKFLPMMERTWRMRPGRDWYVFAEADTYVFWTNMIYWLRKQSRLNPQDKHFLGSRSFLGGTPFAHGGSGYVLSGALLKHLIKHYQDVMKQYNIKSATECCGDLILAQALDEFANTKMLQVWPMFNGEKPNTLPFGPGHWCEPILTMHHMNAEEVSNVWQFEKMQKTDNTLLIKDLYHGLVEPKMQPQRQNWDNLSDDVCYINPDNEAQTRANEHERSRQKEQEEMTSTEKSSWKSSKHCARVCEEEDKRQKNRRCFQYRWHDGVCCTASTFKLGVPKAAPVRDKETRKWVSGWNLNAIGDWIGTMGECEHIAWKTPEA